MTRIVTRTIYGAELQTCKEIGKPHTMTQQGCLSDAILTNYAGTVNIIDNLPGVLTEGQDIIPSAWDPETDTDNARLGYFCIGNGAHRAVSGGTGGIVSLQPQPHRAWDSGPYHLIPFVIRELAVGTNATDGDLTPVQRQNYRLRRILTKGGKRYAAYFAKKLNFADAAVVRELVTVTNGNSSVSAFSPVDSNMKPTIPTSVSNTDTTLLRVSAAIEVPFGPTDVEELRNVCEVLYGDVNAAVISECLFCHGVDRTVVNQYPLTGVQTPVDRFSALPVDQRPKEVVGMQVSIYMTTAQSAALSDDLGFNMNVGASEPLYGDLVV